MKSLRDGCHEHPSGSPSLFFLFCCSTLLVLLLSCTPVLSLAQSAGQGVVGKPVSLKNVDPSFELGEDAPQGWRNINLMLNGSYLWDTGTVHSGKRSVAICGTRYRYGRWRSDKLPVSHDGYSWYTFTGWVKTEHNGGEVYLCLAWLDAEGHLITTSDSAMLSWGDSDWQQVSVSALPAAGAVSLELWCISNHNGGQTWFDDLTLNLLVLPGKSSATYDAFLSEYPSHSLTVDAHRMRVQSIYTQAKWTKEKGWADPAEQVKASELFAQAASIPRMDSVLMQAVPAEQVASVQSAYEALVDKALLMAALCAYNTQDYPQARQLSEQVIQRAKTEQQVVQARANLDMLTKIGQ